MHVLKSTQLDSAIQVTPRAKSLPLTDPDRAAASSKLSRAMATCGYGPAEVARRLGMATHTKVCHWARLDHESTLPGYRREQLARVMPRLYRALCELDEAAAVKAPGLCPSQHLALVGAEFGDVARELAQCMADGKLDSGECKRLRKELGELVQAAQAMMGEM